MLANKINSVQGAEFTFRANYYYGENDNKYLDGDKTYRIGDIHGWPIVGANDENGELDDLTPAGIYLGISIGKKHTVSVTITEDQLRDMLASVERLKRDYKIATPTGGDYSYDTYTSNPASYTLRINS